MKSVDTSRVKELLLNETNEPRDALPYTQELKKLLSLYNATSPSPIDEASLMHAILSVAKRGGFGGGRRSNRSGPAINTRKRVFIGRWLGSRLAARASVLYTQEFDNKFQEYIAKFDPLTKSEFWRIVDRVAKATKGEDWRSLLSKAKESACLAVETYNKPLVLFKSEAFIALMVIAWTSLMQSFFYRIGVSPEFTQDKGKPKRYWGLKTCIQKYFYDEESSISKNLEFFIGLRNEIEHYKSPELDPQIFGECQALVMNFEDFLANHFGKDEALSNSLNLAIQFSRIRDSKQLEAMRSLQKPIPNRIKDYISDFRSQLSSDIWNSMEYSYRVFLVPKIDTKENRSHLAVQFAPLDPNNPEDLKQLEDLKGLIVEKQVAVANKDKIKPSRVCEEVEKRLAEQGVYIKLSPSYHHHKLARYYNVKPAKGSKNPKKTIPDFCVYDPAHEDYLYTPKWVSHLVKEIAIEGNLEKALKG